MNATVLSFKEKIDLINEGDVTALRLVKSDKTVNAHLTRFKKAYMERSEINAFTKLLTSSRFAAAEREASIEALKRLTLSYQTQELALGEYGDVLHFTKPIRISREQTLEGKAWLRSYFFKKNGEARGFPLAILDDLQPLKKKKGA